MKKIPDSKTLDDVCSKFQQDIKVIVAGVLNIKASRISIGRDLSEFNLESLSVANLAQVINSLYLTDLTAANFFGHRTLSDLTQYILNNQSKLITDFYRASTGKLSSNAVKELLNRSSYEGRYISPSAKVLLTSPQVSDYVSVQPSVEAEISTYSICITADSFINIVRIAENIIHYLNQSEVDEGFYRNLACFLATEIESDTYRVAFVIESNAELLEQLTEFVKEDNGNLSSSASAFSGVGHALHKLDIFERDNVTQKLRDHLCYDEGLNRVAMLWAKGVSIDWREISFPAMLLSKKMKRSILNILN